MSRKEVFAPTADGIPEESIKMAVWTLQGTSILASPEQTKPKSHFWAFEGGILQDLRQGGDLPSGDQEATSRVQAKQEPPGLVLGQR